MPFWWQKVRHQQSLDIWNTSMLSSQKKKTNPATNDSHVKKSNDQITSKFYLVLGDRIIFISIPEYFLFTNSTSGDETLFGGKW